MPSDNGMSRGGPSSGGATGVDSGMAGTLPSQGPFRRFLLRFPPGTINPVGIEPGTDTGTIVAHTIQSLRGELTTLQDRIVASCPAAGRSGKSAGGQSAGDYHEAKAHITTRLQIGTTPAAIPNSSAKWNSAQSSLDQLTVNINLLNALGTQVADQSSRAHYVLSTVQATFDVSGAVDEDHRQLKTLEDETNQTIVLIDRLMMEVSDNVQRQTSYVANERANLTTLAAAIKNGELYGAELGSGMIAGAAPPSYASPTSGAALVTIKFDRSSVDYQQILYTALAQALQTRPGASFDVLAVSPTRGTAASVQLAQNEAQRHAQSVMRSMTDSGRAGDAAFGLLDHRSRVGSSEVRVYVR